MKTKQILPLVFSIAVIVLFLQGCAHSQMDQQLDQKLAAEPNVATISDLRKEDAAAIRDSKSLTAEQKQKLLDLHHTTHVKSDELREQSFKLRALLIQDLIKENYNGDEVHAIKDRLEKVEKQRLNLVFAAVDQANLILGHESRTSDNERVMATIYDNNL
jgi:hypothetical protein